MKSKIITSFILAICLSVSCKEDEHVTIDGPSGPVTIVGLPAIDTLRNIINAEIKYDQNSAQLAKLEVFANDSLIASGSSNSLALSWNTLHFKDANYNIRAVATDVSGQKKEVSRKVVVSNALVSIHRSLVLGLFTTVDFLITDTAGNIIGKKHFSKHESTSGEYMVIYPNKPYNGDRIHLVRVLQEPRTVAECFLDVKRGSLITDRSMVERPKYENLNGPTPINVKNVPAYDHFTVSTDGSGYTLPAFLSSSPIHYTNESKLYMQIEKGDAANYHLFSIPKPGSEFTFDASTCMTPSTGKTILFSAPVSNLSVNVHGRPFAGYSEKYMITSKYRLSGSQLKIFYPDTLFKQYSSYINFSHNGIYFGKFYRNSLPDSKIELPDFKATVTNRSLLNAKMSIDGSYDLFFATYYNKIPGQQGQILLHVIGAPNTTNMKVPAFWKELTIPNFHSEDFLLYEIQMGKYDRKVNQIELFSAFPGRLFQLTDMKKVTLGLQDVPK